MTFLKKNKNYRLYFLSHICQHTGDAMIRIASLLTIEFVAPDSGTALSILLMCETLPQIIITPLGGILADRYDRRRLMIIFDSIATVGVLTYILAHRSGDLLYLYAATIFRSCITALYMPVSTSITSMFVSDPEDLKRISLMNGMAWSIMLICGGLIGGFISAAFGVEACYLFDSGTYFLSVLCMKRVVGTFTVSPDSASKQHTIESIFESKLEKELEKKSIARRMRESIRRCFRPLCHCLGPTKNLLSYLFACGFGMLIFMKASAAVTWGSEDVLNVLISKVPGDEDESSRRLGIIIACQGFGSLLGPILANALLIDGRRPRTIQTACIASFFLIIFGWVGIANAPNFELICFFTLVRCMGGSTIFLNSTLVLQNLTKPDMLGRVLAYQETLTNLLLTIMAYIAGNFEDSGFGKKEIAYLSASLAVFFVAFWSSYHLFGLGAARKESLYSDDDFFSRRASIDMLHSPAIV